MSRSEKSRWAPPPTIEEQANSPRAASEDSGSDVDLPPEETTAEDDCLVARHACERQVFDAESSVDGGGVRGSTKVGRGMPKEEHGRLHHHGHAGGIANEDGSVDMRSFSKVKNECPETGAPSSSNDIVGDSGCGGSGHFALGNSQQQGARGAKALVGCVESSPAGTQMLVPAIRRVGEVAKEKGSFGVPGGRGKQGVFGKRRPVDQICAKTHKIVQSHESLSLAAMAAG